MTTLKDIYQQHLAECIQRQCASTKTHIDTNRSQFANHRHSCGFSESMRQLTFALCMERSEGAHVYDIDGNKYIDLTMGFGVHLFGHSPAFVTNALQHQLTESYSLGPVHRLSARAASLICDMTRNERCAFFNSGTEAVMVALRLARAATGKSKIVLFEGAYHGTHDPLLAIKTQPGTHAAVANVPGISQALVQDTILLEFGTEESLRFIEANAADIAAVITEPVRSRHTEDVNPDFLQGLQTVCKANNIAFVLDEIITGFRVCNGGAKELFSLDPDIITYGKVLGGGMPIGVVAGKKKYLDYIDGGTWSFGDESGPSSPTTFVAGTFCHHPLTMAAAVAVMEHLKASAGQLQQELEQHTASFCADINAFCSDHNIPISLAHFGSMFRFLVKPRHKILYHALLKENVYVWEGRTCFLSTAHDDAIRGELSARIKKCLLEMRAAGYFSSSLQTMADTNWYIRGGLSFNTLLNEQWLELSFNYLCECLRVANKHPYSYSFNQPRQSDIRLFATDDNNKTNVILECLKPVGDGWSLTIFFRFLSECYRSLENGQPLPANPFKDKAAFIEWAGGERAENNEHAIYDSAATIRYVSMEPMKNNLFEWLLAAFAISMGDGDTEIGIPVSGQLVSRQLNVFHNCTCQIPVKLSVNETTTPDDLLATITQQVSEGKKDFRRRYLDNTTHPYYIAFNVDNLQSKDGFAGKPVTALNIIDDYTKHNIFCNIIVEDHGYHICFKYRLGIPKEVINMAAVRLTAIIQGILHVHS